MGEDCYYNLNYFENVEWSNKNTIVLPQKTIDLINLLSEHVGSPDYIKTPIFTHNIKSNNTKKKHTYDNNLKTEDWESIRNFKKTEICKNEVGIKKDIDAIRLLINKLTEKTYDKLSLNILELIDHILNEQIYDDDSLNTIGHAVFNMASNNKFNSQVYAKLCNLLINRYSFITPILNNSVNEFMKLFECMEFVSPENNYDKFCEINLLNDKRRSMSLFLCNLYHNNVIPLSIIVNYIKMFQNTITSYIHDHTRKMEIEELSENLFILITNIEFSVLNQLDDWSNIYNNLCVIKNADLLVMTGISHKTKFKHMDIIDKCK